MPSATPGWRRDPLSRTLAATGAVVVTLAMLALFARPSWHAPGPSGASVRIALPLWPVIPTAPVIPTVPVMPPTPRALSSTAAAPIATPPARAPARPAPSSRRIEPATPLAIAPPAAVAPAVAEPPPAATAQAPDATDAASAPLKLDRDTLRRAIAGARSPTRRMADAAGAEMDTEVISSGKALERDVARSVKPGCFEPNAGGSLLSPIFIAIAMARDRCKP